MIQILKDFLWGWRYKKAVRKANELAQLTGTKYYVIYFNGRLKVCPKRNLKELIRRKKFKKGVRIQDIERRALYVTL
jgi:hypothetical protein